MNKQRRNDIFTAISMLEGARDTIIAAGEEEREYFDSMPEGLANGEKGQAADEAATNLEATADSLYDLIETLYEVTNT